MKIPVCVRDGSVPGVIKIGEFEFEIDLTELSTPINHFRAGEFPLPFIPTQKSGDHLVTILNN